jgi:anaerobic ribonucleoside-triphosphate reductase
MTEEHIPTNEEQYRLAFKLALRNGSPYFESQCHVENPLNSISCVQCCAYGFQSDAESDKEFYNKLNFVDGAHFDNLGSMQVISLNLPRAAYISVGQCDPFWYSLEYLKGMIDKCVEIFKHKRNAISKQASPFMRQTPTDPNDPTKNAPPFADLSKLSFVIGLVGLNEYVQVMTGKQLHESDEAVDLGLHLVAALNLYCGRVGHVNDMSISLARTPAETTAQRFAVSDLMNYPDQAVHYVKGNVESALEGLSSGTKNLPVEYSNGTHCAVNAPIALAKKAEIEGKFFEILRGGNMFHVFLSDVSPFMTLDTVLDENAKRVPKTETKEEIDDLMAVGLNFAKNTPISYFAFSKDMTICLKCNSTSCGIHDKCPRCSSDLIDHVARITGYNSAVSGWNAAKKEELKMRHRYDVTEIIG